MVEPKQDRIAPLIHLFGEARQHAGIGLAKELAQAIKAATVRLEEIIFQAISRVVNCDPPGEVRAYAPLTRTSSFE
jgi:hypothetical protein